MKEHIWKIGITARRIYRKLSEILDRVESCPEIYLSDEILLDLDVQKEMLDLANTDDYFRCMTKADFGTLRPSNPIEPDEFYENGDDPKSYEYEDVEYPDSDPPHNVFDLEDCSYRVEIFFKELQSRKVSVDGFGCGWPSGSSRWVPREKCRYEELYNGSRMPPSVPWTLHRAYYNDNKPHQLYHALHGDEGREAVISRTELEILIRCMKGRMADPKLCVHIVPVLLLSIHGVKARIMTAHFDLSTNKLNIKYSRFEQFDGFEVKEGARSKDGRVRPHDFEAKRDLFFRWLNPICQGNTFLEDSKDAEELVLRGPKGRKRLVRRRPSPTSSSLGSSKSVE